MSTWGNLGGETEKEAAISQAGGDWDENVPLAYPIEQRDLATAGDVGNALVPADSPWASKEAAATMSGYPTQLALLRGAAAQSLERKPLYSSTDPCRPGSALCGPTRPKEDHGGDIVLTKGWLGEPDPYPCCPCLGKGVRTINYADYTMAGTYNPYTMELCQLCDSCTYSGAAG